RQSGPYPDYVHVVLCESRFVQTEVGLSTVQVEFRNPDHRHIVQILDTTPATELGHLITVDVISQPFHNQLPPHIARPVQRHQFVSYHQSTVCRRDCIGHKCPGHIGCPQRVVSSDVFINI